MKVLLFANTDWYLWNFRRELVQVLQRDSWEVILVSPPGAFVERLRSLGARWIAVQMQRDGINPLTELASVAALSAIYRREKPDIVHHFTLKAVIHGSLAAWSAGIRARVNAIAGLGYIFCSPDYRARLLRPVIRLLLRAALSGKSSITIFQNPEDARELTLHGVAATARSRLIRGSGVDTRRFDGTKRGPAERCRVLLATRLLWSKGVADYVAAAGALAQAGLPADFLVAGAPDHGSPDSIPEEAIAKWRDGTAVHFLGHVNDMDQLLKTVDIVVLPSRYAEGVPRILLEAAASSIAIVATDQPGCREIVEHNATGLLIAPSDVAALADALRSLIMDPARRSALGAAARRKAQTEFEESHVIAATIQVYREAMDMARHAPTEVA